MAKPPLIHFPGALFHITTRGNNKQTVFFGSRDFSRYLLNLKKVKQQMPFYLYAFALMPNHLHLLVEVRKFSINKIMHKLQTAYSMYFNKRYGNVGHVFQGRYFSILVEKEPYLLELIRYIHLNPVRAGIVERVEDYTWTSHNAYLGIDNESAKYVDHDKVLLYFSADPKKAVQNYREFVLAGIGRQWEEIASEIKRVHILGSSKFVQAIDRRISKSR